MDNFQHYIDLNDPYLQMNIQRIQDGQDDYLAMLSPPDFETISSPHSYVNEMPDSMPEPPSGYLLMKPANIFSPRDKDANVFVFDDLKTNNQLSVGSGEVIPMLETHNESDSETLNSPKSYANPSYNVLPRTTNGHFDILKSKDNYVNMPKHKSAIINDREHHYVNGNINVCNAEQTCL